jgi:spore cortex formation protein SpoVR/YcgB (stage V sporulation)
MYTTPTRLDLVAQMMKMDREELRAFAKRNGIETGRNKIDTVMNIIDKGRARLFFKVELIEPHHTKAQKFNAQPAAKNPPRCMIDYDDPPPVDSIEMWGR